MKNTHFASARKEFSTAGEKINSIIERDIALTFFIMLFGLLLRNDSGFRGFPAGWLYSGSDTAMHSRPEMFFASLLASALLVIAGELVTFFIKKATEPDASVSSGTDFKANQATVYANTYDDSSVQTERASSDVKVRENKSRKPVLNKSAGEIKVPSLPLNRRENPVFKSLGINPVSQSGSKSSSSGESGSGSGDAVLKAVIIAFSLIVLLVIGMAISLSPSDDMMPYEYEDEEQSYSFYNDPEFMQGSCDDAFALLVDNDIDALREIGGGSPEKLLSMADWENLSYSEDSRILTVDEKDYGFIRYYAETEDGKTYMVAFKFEGGDLANDESTAELVGIAACPYEVWDEYYADDDWDTFVQNVGDRMQYVGDVEYNGDNILIW